MAYQPWDIPLGERLFHPPQGQIEIVERRFDFLRRKAFRAHLAIEMLAQRANVGALGAIGFLIDALERLERHVECRHADRRRRHFFEKAQPLSHVRAANGIVRAKARLRENFIEIFADHARIQNDVAVMD